MNEPSIRVLLISYDLSDRTDTGAVSQAIRSVSVGWWHHLDSSWIIKTRWTPLEMRDALRPVLSADDEVFIADITDAEAAWRGFPARGTQWLENNLA